MSDTLSPLVSSSWPWRQAAARQRLSTRIVAMSLLALLLVLAMVSGTLWLSWQLEGASAAINDTGSLRMRANRVQIELIRARGQDVSGVRKELALQQRTLALLSKGDASRPLFLPDSPEVRAQMDVVSAYWREQLQPAAEQAMRTGNDTGYLTLLPGFIDEANRLVLMIEHNSERKTTLLRMSQGVLGLAACIGTLAMIYLLYLWIILPVLRLQDGVRRMARHDFGVRLPVESRDEFGELTEGFNHMVGELESLYRELEARVESKTQQLAAQNHELSTLYDMLTFLNSPAEIETLCRGFLTRVMARFGATGASLRVLDPQGERLHLLVSEGLSAGLVEAERCAQVDACYCGLATREGAISIADLHAPGRAEPPPCSREGFAALTVFPIVSSSCVLGSFSLHFASQKTLSADASQLLTLLGQHLGVALDNRRLSARSRELAVAEERSLMAQGLHDSIAQGLNFLKMQVGMLDDALRAGNTTEMRDIVPLLQCGIEESYQDVRELLLNFRSKLGQGELLGALRDTVARFERQTGVDIQLQVEADEGPPLPPEQQLQVLFIVQEALSNVRKHAGASKVQLHFCNGADFSLTVSDNGSGYDPDEVAARADGHIGLHIMRERAKRIRATLETTTAPGAGTRVCLRLPRIERQAA